MSNPKFEITDIAHEKYPFLHRIRALRDIGEEVKAGDLGGFVEREDNLSFASRDDSWIFNDAIAAGRSRVSRNSILRDRAIVCGSASISYGTEMTGDSRVEDSAVACGAMLLHHARISGNGIVTPSPDTNMAPSIGDNCSVYGKVEGGVILAGSIVVINDETISNNTLDRLLINNQKRIIIRDPSRDELTPYHQEG